MIDASDAEVYEKYAAELVRFATMLAGPSNAEDLVADAVVRVFLSPGWPAVTNQRAYLYRSVLHEAASSARSSRRRTARERRVGRWGNDGTPADLRPDVVEAARALSVRQRAVVFMTFWLDAPSDEIADVLSLSTRTVQRELQAALTRMERHLS